MRMEAYETETLYWVSADKRKTRVQELNNNHLYNIIAMLKDGRWQKRTRCTSQENADWLSVMEAEQQKRK